MPEYTPESMPEITVHFYYAPAEYQEGYMVEKPEVSIHSVRINGNAISMDLEDHLIGVFGNDWEVAIMRMANKRRVA